MFDSSTTMQHTLHATARRYEATHSAMYRVIYSAIQDDSPSSIIGRCRAHISWVLHAAGPDRTLLFTCSAHGYTRKHRQIWSRSPPRPRPPTPVRGCRPRQRDAKRPRHASVQRIGGQATADREVGAVEVDSLGEARVVHTPRAQNPRRSARGGRAARGSLETGLMRWPWTSRRVASS